MIQSTPTEQFVSLLTRNERKVYGYILSLVPNWVDADEIQQETNLRLWQQFDKYEPGTDFVAWACTIAYYQVLTHRKRVGRQRVQFSQAFIEAVAHETAGLRGETDTRLSALEGCIGRLSELGRKTLELCYQRGLPIKQAAAQIGKSVEATYKTLARLRLALHQCIEQSLHHDRLSHDARQS